MATNDRPSRREFIQITLGTVAAATLLPACKGGGGAATLSCMDTSSLSPTDAQMRATLAYDDKSLDPIKKCSNCLQFVPAAPDSCGGCKVVKGPIHPNGNCRAWVAKPAAG